MKYYLKWNTEKVWLNPSDELKIDFFLFFILEMSTFIFDLLSKYIYFLSITQILAQIQSFFVIDIKNFSGKLLKWNNLQNSNLLSIKTIVRFTFVILLQHPVVNFFYYTLYHVFLVVSMCNRYLYRMFH